MKEKLTTQTVHDVNTQVKPLNHFIFSWMTYSTNIALKVRVRW